MIDARAIDEPKNADEVIAWSLQYLEPGDVIALHGDWCRQQLDVAADCTCQALVLTIGARA